MRRVFNCTLFVLVLAQPLAAAAQGRVPAAESAAVGVDVGVFLPREDAMGSGPTIEGFYEYYLEPRTSVRLGVGWANPNFDVEEEDKLRYLRVAGDLVLNWEGGAVHPFFGAGLGVYFLQEKDDGRSVGDQHTKFGGTVFGGAEFFTDRAFAVKAEARYHAVANFRRFNPDGLALTVGVKAYF